MTAPIIAASTISDATVVMLSRLMEARTGQRLAANRAWRVETALRSIAAERSFASVDELVRRVAEGRDPAIVDRVVDALLNQETSFFRDAGAIEAAAEAVAAIAEGVPNIWCAGCATGQEPLSFAMAFAEAGHVRPEIIATDVSDAAIKRGRAGRYTQFEIQRGLPVRRMLRWFEQDGNDWVASPELVRQIIWKRHNLVGDPAPPRKFDAIFCRNVLFYLAPALRTRVLEMIANSLRPGGLLMLGAGETVIGQTERFAPSMRFRGLYEVVPKGSETVYLLR